jgi:hypothetical protein
VATPLLGAVVLPRLTGVRTGEANGPVVTLPPPSSAPAANEPGGPSPEETAVLDADRTQPLRLPTAASRPSPPAVRPRQNGEGDDVTAVIEMSPAANTESADGKSDER